MKSLFKIQAVIGLMILIGTVAVMAEDYKIEITPFGGYTFSNGVQVQPTDIGDDQIVDELIPVSGYSYGVQVDYLFTENAAIGFLWSMQSSELQGRIRGSGKQNFADMDVHNFHAVFTYTMNEEEDSVRPFVFGGLGATYYSPGDIEGYGGSSSTKFSSTWGGGVKVFVSDHVGLKFTGRWTPTYINSSSGGIWCNPWYPWQCWVVAESNFSHQFEMSAGLIFRF